MNTRWLLFLALCGVPSISFAGPASPSALCLRDDDTDLASRLRSDDFMTRSRAIEAVGDLASKAPKGVIVPLVQVLGDDNGNLANQAAAALGRVGKKARKVIAQTLESGVCEGVDVPAYRSVRAACRLGKAGQQMVRDHLETRELTWPVAHSIREHSEPRDALRFLIELAERPGNTPWAIEALRGLRHSKDIEPKHVQVRTRKLEGSLGAAIDDAMLGIDATNDHDRMQAWLRSNDRTEFESALWSVGMIGAPLVDLAPDVSKHIASEHERVRSVALWALGSLAEKGASCPVPDVFTGAAAGALAIGGGASRDADQVQRALVRLAQLESAENGTVNRRRLRSRFGGRRRGAAQDADRPNASTEEDMDLWLDAARHGSEKMPLEPILALRDGAAPDALSLDSELSGLVGSVQACLSHASVKTQDAAGAVLLNWGIESDEHTRWLLDAAARGVDRKLDVPAGAYLLSHAAALNESGDALVAALEQPYVAGAAAQILVQQGSASTAIAHLVRCERPWKLREHHVAAGILATGSPEAAKLAAATRDRFRAGELLMGAHLARQGAAAHDVLRDMLKSETTDVRMVAVCTIGAQGTDAASLLPAIQAMDEGDRVRNVIVTRARQRVEG